MRVVKRNIPLVCIDFYDLVPFVKLFIMDTSETHLDIVLSKLNESGLSITLDKLESELSGKLNGSILWQLLDKLKDDSYISYCFGSAQIKQGGKIFIKDGGYTKKKEMEVEMYDNIKRCQNGEFTRAVPIIITQSASEKTKMEKLKHWAENKVLYIALAVIFCIGIPVYSVLKKSDTSTNTVNQQNNITHIYNAPQVDEPVQKATFDSAKLDAIKTVGKLAKNDDVLKSK